MVDCFSHLSSDSSCRCVLFTSAGPVFTAGLDLTDAAQTLFSVPGDDPARKAFFLRQNLIRPYQDTFTSIEKVHIWIYIYRVHVYTCMDVEAHYHKHLNHSNMYIYMYMYVHVYLTYNIHVHVCAYLSIIIDALKLSQPLS